MINFTKQPLAINPAYNDSIIEYTSTLTGVTYSNIYIGATPFKTYPVGGVFTYNFKPIVSVLINENQFRDSIIPDFTTAYVYEDNTLNYRLQPTIRVYNSTTYEETTTSFEFIKSVEQLIGYREQSGVEKSIRVLLPTKNKTDYFLPYFEGYPCDFGIYGIPEGATYNFKNVTTISDSPVFTGETFGTTRVYLSDGGQNEYASNFLGLSTTDNLVELWVNDSFVSNITIKRNNSRCGVYLKWFNNSGSYSYWLFDPVYSDTLQTKTLDDLNGEWDNLQNVSATSRIAGKSASRTIKISTRYTETEKEYLLSILTSPMVEMYVNQTPFNRTDINKFIGVTLNDGSTPRTNKSTNNKLDLTITLPAIYTQTL